MATHSHLGSLLYGLCLFSMCTVSVDIALAQTITTLIPDPSLGTIVSQNGTAHTITGGTIRGANLFHSFDRFEVGTGETARFTGPVNVEHILSRVTGGQQSIIDGTLQSDIPGAALYLLNPTGVLFGPNARLNVQGALHVSTADIVHLEDAGAFRVDLSEESLLSVAAPATFGFLQEPSAGIRIDESVLAVPRGQTLNVVGGGIDIVGGVAGILVSSGGRIALTSVSSPGQVTLNPNGVTPDMEQDPAVTDGRIHLSDVAVLDVRDEVGGTIHLEGGEILLEGGSVLDARGADSGTIHIEGGDIRFGDQSVLVVSTETDRPGTVGGITIHATGTLTLLEGSFLNSATFGSSRAGDITVTAENIHIRDGSFISSSTFGAGDSGQVTVRARAALTIRGGDPVSGLPSAIAGQVRASSSGSAGDVVIEAGTLLLTDGGVIFGDTASSGDGSHITIRVSDVLMVRGSNPLNGVPSAISAQALVGSSGATGALSIDARALTVSDGGRIHHFSFGTGSSGQVAIRVRDTLTITGDGSLNSSGIISEMASAGVAGEFLIEARDLILTNGGQIGTSTSGLSDGGRVTVRIGDTITISGRDSAASRSTSGIFLRVSAGSFGSAGDISIEAQALTLTDGGQIGSNTRSSGNGGRITVQVSKALSIVGVDPVNALPSGILAETEASGAAGDISIEASELSISEGGNIASNTRSSGPGGRVVIQVQNGVDITGMDPVNALPSTIVAETVSSGQAGEISIEAQSLTLTDGGQINSNRGGSGGGGSVSIHVRDTITITGSSPLNTGSSGISAGAGPGSSGLAGDILVETQMLNVTDGGQISSETFSQGDGGRVTVRVSDTLSLTGTDSLDGSVSGIFVSSSGRGRGGDLDVRARRIQLTEGARIEGRSTRLGNAGDITIAALDRLTSDQGAVRTDSVQADGGSITLRAGNLIQLRNSEISARVGGGRRTVGGNILITSAFAVIQNSQVVADAREGQGGNIQITAQQAVLIDPLSVLDASSQLGLDGFVDVQAPVTDLSGAVAPLQQSFAASTSLLLSRCANRVRGEGTARFVLAGRDRSPVAPSEFLPSPFAHHISPMQQTARRTPKGYHGRSIPTSRLAALKYRCQD